MCIKSRAAFISRASFVSTLGIALRLVLLLLWIAHAGSEYALNTEACLGPVLTSSSALEKGRSLFERNCAHCHGEDARGDEGPNLYDLTLSDEKIARRIKEGIKGEMPRFGGKLNDADIKALTIYLRSLNTRH